MSTFNLNEMPEADDPRVRENQSEETHGTHTHQDSNVGIDLNNLPQPEEDMLLNESVREVIHFFTALYFPIVLQYLR